MKKNWFNLVLNSLLLTLPGCSSRIMAASWILIQLVYNYWRFGLLICNLLKFDFCEKMADLKLGDLWWRYAAIKLLLYTMFRYCKYYKQNAPNVQTDESQLRYSRIASSADRLNQGFFRKSYENLRHVYKIPFIEILSGLLHFWPLTSPKY